MPKQGESIRWLGRIHLGIAGMFVLLFIAVGLVTLVEEQPAANDPVTPAPIAEASTEDDAISLPDPLRVEMDEPFELNVGQCFDISYVAGEIDDVISRDCHEKHEYEVYSAEPFTQVGYPDSFAFDAHYNVYCIADFEMYMGQPWHEGAAVGFFALYPGRDAWRAGDRTPECVVYHLTEARLEGSLKYTGIDGRR